MLGDADGLSRESYTRCRIQHAIDAGPSNLEALSNRCSTQPLYAASNSPLTIFLPGLSF